MDSSGEIVISDRDQTGTQMTSQGYTISQTIWWAPIGLWFTGTTLGNVFPMIRSDGHRMIGGFVQGARSYDPTSGQWKHPIRTQAT